MGKEYQAKCKKCDYKFQVKVGGGFYFHVLHCDKCGKDKEISFDEIGEPHLQYLKGLNGSYCVASREDDKLVRENYQGDSISEKEYFKVIEKILGKCGCGGNFKMNAPVRCPKCRSEDIEDSGEAYICYD